MTKIKTLDLVITFNKYTGNFEREFIAYSTGLLDYVGIRVEDDKSFSNMFWKDVFNKDMKAADLFLPEVKYNSGDSLDKYEFEDYFDRSKFPKTYKLVDKLNHIWVWDDDWKQYNFYSIGECGKNAKLHSIKIHLTKKLSLGEYDRIMMRAMKFADTWNSYRKALYGSSDDLEFISCHYENNEYDEADDEEYEWLYDEDDEILEDDE